MNIKRLVMLSFGVKFIIAVFFVAILYVNYILCQALFNQTSTVSAIRRELKDGIVGVNEYSKGSTGYTEASGLTALMLASQWGDLEKAKMLVEEFAADVNLKSQNEQGTTALHEAVKNAGKGFAWYYKKDWDDTKLVDENLVFGDADGKKKAESLEIIKLLLKHGAEINARDNFGNTPLHCVADIPMGSRVYAKGDKQINDGKREVVTDFLIKNGADINAQNNDGYTLLHSAVQMDQDPFIIWFLKKYGSRVDPTLKNKQGQTFLQLAKDRNVMTVKRAVEEGLKYVTKK